jgi:hypothetical protein
MSESDLQKEIMKAVKKVNKMNINMGQTQYQGRGEDSSAEEAEVPSPDPEVDQTTNIYDQEEAKSYQAARDIMKDIKKRFETVNLGDEDYTKMLTKLKKVQAMMGKGAVGGESDFKSKIKKLKATDPKLYYKLKAKMDVPEKKSKKKKASGGAKPKREMSDKQKEWMAFVKELSQKEKYKGMKRPELMKIASQKYKKQ